MSTADSAERIEAVTATIQHIDEIAGQTTVIVRILRERVQLCSMIGILDSAEARYTSFEETVLAMTALEAQGPIGSGRLPCYSLRSLHSQADSVQVGWQ